MNDLKKFRSSRRYSDYEHVFDAGATSHWTKLEQQCQYESQQKRDRSLTFETLAPEITLCRKDGACLIPPNFTNDNRAEFGALVVLVDLVARRAFNPTLVVKIVLSTSQGRSPYCDELFADMVVEPRLNSLFDDGSTRRGHDAGVKGSQKSFDGNGRCDLTLQGTAQ